MNIIVAVDKHWGIGKNGQLLVSIPADKQMFREETMGKVIVMGRATFEGLPGGQPLYGRTNIVLSRNPKFQAKGAKVCHSMEEALKELAQYQEEDIFIIGGQEIYEQFLPYCNVAHVTYIDYTYEADVYFPNLERDEQWKLAADSDEKTYFDICYEFRLYVKRRSNET